MKNTITKVSTKTIGLGVAVLLTALSAQAEPLAYIPDSDGYISVFDTATNTEIDNIQIVTQNIETSFNGETLYTTKWSSGIPVYDAATATLITTIPTGSNPRDLVISHDLDRGYTANYLSNSITVFDTNTNTVIDTIAVNTKPTHVVLNQDSTRAYVSYYSGKVITIIDTATNTVVNSITLNTTATSTKDMIASPTEPYIYVISSGKYAHIINTETETEIGRISVPSTAAYLAVTPDNSKLYVGLSSISDFKVYVYDALMGTSLGTINIGKQAQTMKVHPDGSALYVDAKVTTGYGYMHVIDTATDTITDTVGPIGTAQYNMTITPLPEKVTGSTTGLKQMSVVCSNLTTSQQVTIPLLVGKSWDCENEGLVVNSGDTVNMSVTGDVK